MNAKNANNEVLKDAGQIAERLRALRNDSQRGILMRFFKTGPGEYGEGDEFLGIKVPVTRSVVKQVDKRLPLTETEQLLLSPWHEVRLCALLILVNQFSRFANHNDQEAMEAARRNRQLLPPSCRQNQQLGSCRCLCSEDHRAMADVLYQLGAAARNH